MGNREYQSTVGMRYYDLDPEDTTNGEHKQVSILIQICCYYRRASVSLTAAIDMRSKQFDNFETILNNK